jgi:hypothetical protein
MNTQVHRPAYLSSSATLLENTSILPRILLIGFSSSNGFAKMNIQRNKIWNENDQHPLDRTRLATKCTIITENSQAMQNTKGTTLCALAS